MLLTAGVGRAQSPTCGLQGVVMARPSDTLRGASRPLPRAQVALLRGGQLLAVRLTDYHGAFAFDSLHVGEAQLLVQAAGYGVVDTLVRLPQPVGDGPLVVRMYPQSPSGSAPSEGAASRTYTFGASDSRAASNAKRLLLAVPPMLALPLAGDAPSDQRPLVLLNGLPTTLAELEGVPAQQVVRVDEYELPPYRFRPASRVLDVVTVRLLVGHEGSVGLLLEPLGYYGRLMPRYSYRRGPHSLMVEGQAGLLSARRLVERFDTIRWAGALRETAQGWAQRRAAEGQLLLQYAYQGPEGDLALVRLGGDCRFSRNALWEAMESFATGEARRHGDTLSTPSSRMAPSLEGYYRHHFANGHTLSLDLSSTLHLVRDGWQRRSVYGPAFTAENRTKDLQLDAQHYAVALAGEYGLPYRNWFFALGLQSDNSYLVRSHRMQLFLGGTSYRPASTPFLTNEAHRRALMTTNTLSVRTSATLGEGFQLDLSLRGGLYYLRWLEGYEEKALLRGLFLPAAYLAYRVTPSQTLAYSLRSTCIPPAIYQLDNAPVEEFPYLYFRPSPLLYPATTYDNHLDYRLQAPYLDLTVGASYTHRAHSLECLFQEEQVGAETHYIFTYENAQWYWEAHGIVDLVFKPLGDPRLQLKAYLAPGWRMLKISSGATRGSITKPITLALASQWGAYYGDFTVNFPSSRMGIADNRVAGYRLGLHLGADWTYWSLFLSVDQMALPPTVSYTTRDNQPLQLRLAVTDWRAQWCAQLTVRYRFAFGQPVEQPKVGFLGPAADHGGLSAQVR